ncbi:hypothetical protein ACFQ1I_40705 [Kitasatospora arboriphila]
MFHDRTSLAAVRCRIGVNPSPPVDCGVGRTGASSGAARLVPVPRTVPFSARTAVVAVPGSVVVKPLPSVDHDGVQPGGACKEPGTYVWAVPAPAIGSVMVAAEAAAVAALSYRTVQLTVSPWSAAAAPGWVTFWALFTSADAVAVSFSAAPAAPGAVAPRPNRRRAEVRAAAVTARSGWIGWGGRGLFSTGFSTSDQRAT